MQLHILAGNSQKLDGGAMFGNAPKALWSKWLEPDELNRIDLACRCLLVIKDDGTKILFETGVGNFFEPKLKQRYGIEGSSHQLILNLDKIGLTHRDIDYVVLSHLHFDHAGGLLSSYIEDKASELLFPNAKFIIGKQHWLHAQKPHYRDRASFLPELNHMLAESNRVELVDENNANYIIEGVNFIFSDGHTPGLMLSEITTEQGPLVFCSDLIPGQFWLHLPICMGYDRYPEKLIDEKQLLLQRLVKSNGRLFFTHDANMACAWVKQNEKSRYVAEEAKL